MTTNTTTNNTTTNNTTTQSIFTTLDSLTTTTSVPGQEPKMQQHTLPREAFPTSKQFENKFELMRWANRQGITHAVLQKGVRSHLIDIRAKFKSCKKDDIWSNLYGQNNVDAYEWEVQSRPNQKQGISDAKKAGHLEAGGELAKNMVAAGLDDTVIMSALVPTYGQELAQEILDIARK